MNLNTWKRIRQHLRSCLTRSGDALFELADALSSESAARSLPELSLSPSFSRQWPNVYEALEQDLDRGLAHRTRWPDVDQRG